MLKVAFYTLGCRSNQYETDAMKKICSLAGFEIVKFEETADVYVVNTCTVTGNADKKSRHMIRSAKKKNKNSVVIVTGCYIDAASDELYKIKEADILLKNDDKKNILSYLPKIKSRSSAIIPAPRIRANLMVENGCENFCSYCIVPFVRGKVTSKPIGQAVTEAKQMVDDGVREIILTGINLGEYGRNLTKKEYSIGNQDFRSQASDPHALPKLIEELSKIDGLLRIRLSSIEPMYINDELIKIIKDNPKACRHLHIPLQSGDDKILKVMNRGYTAKDFLKMAKKIKKSIKDISITTDIIVGFPGEDKKAFNNTCKMIDKIKFPRVHMFSYSDRPGTAAFNLKNKIKPKMIAGRYEKLGELRAKYMLEFHKAQQKKPVEVLIEQKDPKTGLYEGLTGNYIRVFWAGDDSGDDCIGKLLPLKIGHFQGECVLAEPILV
ncbi:tRNA (N(6)-L-threonylcarbamoyladenosine(37)-C(2))-methylthiotransferase MtaB [Candidatus Margulisiibacteriota bacterium]